MAIIDPDGLFCGERLANCSDLAQLYWPRFFLAANSCARLELSYKSLVSRVFGNFQKIPESSEIWEIFREYSDNFLAVLYEAPDGGWWCQFITSEKYLPKYKKTRDNLGPAPSFEQMEESRNGYLKWKRSKSITSSLSENFPKVSNGIGVGIGVGEEQIPSPAQKRGRGDSPAERPTVPEDPPIPPEPKPPKPPTKTDLGKARHNEFKSALWAYWQSQNPGVEMPWDGREGAALDIWLRASPQTTSEQFREYLANRCRSQDVNHAERPSAWIGNVTRYAAGPLDRFNKPIKRSGYTNGPPSTESEAYERKVKAIMAERKAHS